MHLLLSEVPKDKEAMFTWINNLSLGVKIGLAAAAITTLSLAVLTFIAIDSATSALHEAGVSELRHVADDVYIMCEIQHDLIGAKLDSDLAAAETLLSSINGGMPPDGAIQIDEEQLIEFAGQRLPALSVGDTLLTNEFAYVDEVLERTGSTCTVFHVLPGKWVRVTTNVKKPDGSRAIGTTLDSSSPVYKAVMRGTTFKGSNIIQGKRFETAYHPLRNPAGEIQAVLYVGVPHSAFTSLRDSVAKITLGETGYVFCINSDRVFTLHPSMIGETYSNPALLDPMIGNDQGVVEYDHDGREKIAAFRYFEPYDWYISSSAYSDEFEAPVVQLRNRSLLLAGLCMVFAALIAGWVGRRIASGVNNIRLLIEDIAQGEGDLTRRLPVSSKDEVGLLAAGFNQFVDKVHSIIVQVARASTEVAGASTEIAAASQEICSSMSEQSSQVDQVTQAATEMSQAIGEVTQRCGNAVEQARESGTVAREGGEVVTATITGMQSISSTVNETSNAVVELGERSEQIGKIVEVINDIADQTNLLALNAAIEAARAGEHGRGFAVVADEVRKLADRTTSATEEISESIREIQDRTKQAVDRMQTGKGMVEEGVHRAESAGESLKQIMASASSVTSVVEGIATATTQQSAAAEEIHQSIEVIAAALREATQGSEQTSEAAGTLSVEAERLQALVKQFKIDQSMCTA